MSEHDEIKQMLERIFEILADMDTRLAKIECANDPECGDEDGENDDDRLL